jgi:hypothetical protein
MRRSFSVFDVVEIQRRRANLASALEQVKETANDISQTQLNFSTERTQFFEKLAIGSGAAVAAIVSYLGAHARGLSPSWMMHAALALLTVTMVSALYRNFRYPNYVLAVKDLNCIYAKVYEQECKKECFEAEPNAISMQTGERINAKKWISEANANERKIEEVIHEKERRQGRLRREFTCAEDVCLVALSFAVIALACLAMRNF